MAIKNSWASGEVLTAADLTDTFKGVFINAQTGTTYTLGTADSFVSISNASGGTVTIPTNATAAFNTGAVVGIMNAGTAGTFTIAGAGGVTVNTTTGGTSLLPLETVYVVKLGTNTWQTKRDPGIANAGGLVYITGSTFSASTAVNVNNCFTSTYDSYRIVLAVDSVSTTNGVNLRLRAGGTDNSSSNYYYNGPHLPSSSAVTMDVYRSAGLATSFVVMHTDNNGSGNCSLDLFNPARSVRTMIAWTFIHQNSTDMRMASPTGLMSVTTSYDGFSLIPTTGNITGNVRVYGYRNS